MLKLVIFLLIGSLQLSRQASIPRIEDASFWRAAGERHLKKILKSVDHNNGMKAKNIIVFIGDGMGMTTITAGRIYKGQRNGQSGEEASLTFDEFPNTGLAKTYNVDKQVPDSAGTATALFSGIKTNYGVIGMDITTVKTNSEKGKLTSIMDWALSVGKRTGIVTTTRISHATPAALYSNSYHRDWECDTTVPELSVGIYKDISRQLVEDLPGVRLNVIMGGGKSTMGTTQYQPELDIDFTGVTSEVCSRSDGRNLTEVWLDISSDRTLALSRSELFAIDTKNTNHLMGLFANDHLTFSLRRPEDREPSLKEMTEKALEVLIRPNSEGFVLVVEGGRIDHGHHQNYAKAALAELLEMDKAIELALEKTDESDTLILVTADHSHAMTFNGYPKRGNDILGFGNKANVSPYETLTYANGPGFLYHRLNETSTNLGNAHTWIKVEDIDPVERNAPNYRHFAAFPMEDETHGGEDIPVYASGPGSELIRGVFEQNYVAYVISYAGCFGPTMHLNKMCNTEQNAWGHSDGISPSRSLLAIMIFYIISYYLFV